MRVRGCFYNTQWLNCRICFGTYVIIYFTSAPDSQIFNKEKKFLAHKIGMYIYITAKMFLHLKNACHLKYLVLIADIIVIFWLCQCCLKSLQFFVM